jgi:hypothetical protein
MAEGQDREGIGAEPGTGTPEDSSAGSEPPQRRRDPRFRVGLLEKLPRLEFTSWSAQADVAVEEEWAGIVQLRSDSVLGPLEPLVAPRRGS